MNKLAYEGAMRVPIADGRARIDLYIRMIVGFDIDGILRWQIGYNVISFGAQIAVKWSIKPIIKPISILIGQEPPAYFENSRDFVAKHDYSIICYGLLSNFIIQQIVTPCKYGHDAVDICHP